MSRRNLADPLTPEAVWFLELSKSFIRKTRIPPDAIPPAGTVDWEKFKALLAHHELYPFIFATVKEASLPIPAELEKFLSCNYYAAIARAQSSWQEFLSVAEVFKEKNVALTPLKGIACLADIYHDRPFRPMADIDILVKEGEFAKAREILGGLGYEVASGGLKEEYWLRKHCELTFTKKKQNRTGILDVHFRLDFKRSVPVLPRLWERIREVVVDGRTIRLLSPEDQLFCLALHQRRFGGKVFCLKNAFDLAMILEQRGKEFDWDYVVREARSGRMRATVFFILTQAKVFFDAAVPETVWKGLGIPRYKKRMAEKLITGHALFPCSPEKSKELFLQMQFVLFDGFWEPLYDLFNVPLEQFAKYYDLEPYAGKTGWLYRLRALYIPYRFVLGKAGS